VSPAWLEGPPAAVDEVARRAARQRQDGRLKPPGSLGRLETAVVRLAGLQGTSMPDLERLHVSVFCGDHGVVAEGVSAYPQAITARMAARFAADGTAIGVLARELDAALEAVDVGMREPAPAGSGVVDARVGAGTGNCACEAAMTPQQRDAALTAGRAAVERAGGRADAFIGGEMGIGNTTPATALACVLLAQPVDGLVGPGAGLDAPRRARKARAIEQALAHHGAAGHPLDALARLGGFEIAALAGAYITAAQRGQPALVDGFIASVAALVAERAAPGTAAWLVATHRSTEPGHDAVLAALELSPLVDLGLHLGEGSGAAVAVPTLRSACALQRDMASLAEAGLATRPEAE